GAVIPDTRPWLRLRDSSKIVDGKLDVDAIDDTRVRFCFHEPVGWSSLWTSVNDGLQSLWDTRSRDSQGGSLRGRDFTVRAAHVATLWNRAWTGCTFAFGTGGLDSLFRWCSLWRFHRRFLWHWSGRFVFGSSL